MLANGPDLLENGAVQFHGGRIEFVGEWRDAKARRRLREPIVDLGEAILSPGLINAHCHLDLGALPAAAAPVRSFTKWARTMVGIRAESNPDSFLANFANNARSLLRSGCSTVVNIGTEPTLSADAISDDEAPNIAQFIEITGVLSGAEPRALVNDAFDRVRRSSSRHPVLGIAPHAPYSTKRETLLELARRAGATPLTIHLAESEEEFELFQSSRGALWEWLYAANSNRAPTRGETPVEYLDRVGLLRPNLLIAHANYLTNSDILRLRRAKTLIAHCPRSHAYFGRPPFRLERLRRSGVRVCLGTDSLASIHAGETGSGGLSLLEEARQFLRAFPSETPRRVFEMMTRIPASYPGFSRKVGAIQADSVADFSVFDYSGAPDDALDALTLDATQAREMWIRGHRRPMHT